MAPDGCHRPFTAKAAFDSRSVHVRFVANKVALGQVFLGVLRFSSVSIMPPMLHTDPHLHVVLTRRTNGRGLKASQTWSSETGEHRIENELLFSML